MKILGNFINLIEEINGDVAKEGNDGQYSAHVCLGDPDGILIQCLLYVCPRLSDNSRI